MKGGYLGAEFCRTIVTCPARRSGAALHLPRRGWGLGGAVAQDLSSSIRHDPPGAQSRDGTLRHCVLAVGPTLAGTGALRATPERCPECGFTVQPREGCTVGQRRR